jgi:hypothetical protein
MIETYFKGWVSVVDEAKRVANAFLASIQVFWALDGANE